MDIIGIIAAIVFYGFSGAALITLLAALTWWGIDSQKQKKSTEHLKQTRNKRASSNDPWNKGGYDFRKYM